ncbi:MAG: hypothetical protein ACJ0BB_01495 [Dehalococcoidia bacterium]
MAEKKPEKTEKAKKTGSENKNAGPDNHWYYKNSNLKRWLKKSNS